MIFKVKETALACPKCREQLVWKDKNPFCRRCRAEYFFRQTSGRNIPQLVSEQNEIVNEKQSLVNRSKDFLKNHVPDWLFYHLSLTYSHQTKKNILLVRRMLEKEKGDCAKVLIIGGGQIRPGNKIRHLGKKILYNSINLEIGPGKNVDIIGDAHQLPFGNKVFDCVISQAVLEHTKDSDRCLKEMFRVLKKNGIIYTEMPFLQPIHMDSDFRRFTLSGLEELHSRFSKIYSGVSAGPASSFGWHLCTFLATALSFNSRKAYDLIYLALFSLMIPFKYLDLIFGWYKTAEISASGIYFLGRK